MVHPSGSLSLYAAGPILAVMVYGPKYLNDNLLDDLDARDDWT